jgi:glycosyltransferase involved in cell wall biosynthesis
MSKELMFSIVVPTYNEEEIIERTLGYLTNLDYDEKEIIVVDDSTDTTPALVQKYSAHGVRLIRPVKKGGRCEARNIGIRSAQGDVVIILNADVFLPKDILKRIKMYYDDGYDVVTLKAIVRNTENLYARYVGMHTRRKEARGIFRAWRKKYNNLWWSEGFSVRRECLLKTSLFPSGFAVPICAGEDVRLVDELRAMGCKGVFDEDIRVEHIAPAKLNEYWHVRKGRGAGTPQIRRFVDGWSYEKIALFATLKVFRFILMIITIIPMVVYNYELATYSERNIFIETIRFIYAWLIERTAMSIGEFQSLFTIIKAERIQ